MSCKVRVLRTQTPFIELYRYGTGTDIRKFSKQTSIVTVIIIVRYLENRLYKLHKAKIKHYRYRNQESTGNCCIYPRIFLQFASSIFFYIKQR
jgi:hypothetical protein